VREERNAKRVTPILIGVAQRSGAVGPLSTDTDERALVGSIYQLYVKDYE